MNFLLRTKLYQASTEYKTFYLTQYKRNCDVSNSKRVKKRSGGRLLAAEVLMHDL